MNSHGPKKWFVLKVEGGIRHLNICKNNFLIQIFACNC